MDNNIKKPNEDNKTTNRDASNIKLARAGNEGESRSASVISVTTSSRRGSVVSIDRTWEENRQRNVFGEKRKRPDTDL